MKRYWNLYLRCESKGTVLFDSFYDALHDIPTDSRQALDLSNGQACLLESSKRVISGGAIHRLKDRAALTIQESKGAVKKRIENPELHSSFSISRQKIGSGGKKAHTSPYPKRRVFAGNQAAAIFFIFLLWYLYRLWPRATRRSSSFTQRSPFLTILLYHLSYFMTPKQPSAWMDRFIRRRAP